MKRPTSISRDIGSPKSPINFGEKAFAYKHGGRWYYRTPETVKRYGRRFIEAATDKELILELHYRGYQVRGLAHECIDRPHLPCFACERGSLRGLLAVAI